MESFPDDASISYVLEVIRKNHQEVMNALNQTYDRSKQNDNERNNEQNSAARISTASVNENDTRSRSQIDSRDHQSGVHFHPVSARVGNSSETTEGENTSYQRQESYESLIENDSEGQSDPIHSNVSNVQIGSFEGEDEACQPSRPSPPDHEEANDMRPDEKKKSSITSVDTGAGTAGSGSVRSSYSEGLDPIGVLTQRVTYLQNQVASLHEKVDALTIRLHEELKSGIKKPNSTTPDEVSEGRDENESDSPSNLRFLSEEKKDEIMKSSQKSGISVMVDSVITEAKSAVLVQYENVQKERNNLDDECDILPMDNSRLSAVDESGNPSASVDKIEDEELQTKSGSASSVQFLDHQKEEKMNKSQPNSEGVTSEDNSAVLFQFENVGRRISYQDDDNLDGECVILPMKFSRLLELSENGTVSVSVKIMEEEELRKSLRTAKREIKNEKEDRHKSSRILNELQSSSIQSDNEIEQLKADCERMQSIIYQYEQEFSIKDREFKKLQGELASLDSDLESIIAQSIRRSHYDKFSKPHNKTMATPGLLVKALPNNSTLLEWPYPRVSHDRKIISFSVLVDGKMEQKVRNPKRTIAVLQGVSPKSQKVDVIAETQDGVKVLVASHSPS